MLHFQLCPLKVLQIFALLLLLFSPATVSCECTCDEDDDVPQHKAEALRYKLGAIASILVAGAIGVSLPLFGSRIRALSPENDLFFMIKAFAAGVILATGFVHILPDAFESLTSPCIRSSPWGKFPFSGFIAMMSAIGTLMIDAFATGYYKRQHSRNHKQVDPGDEEHAGHVHVHTHATHGHAHGSADSPSDQDLRLSQLIRQRIISQVLEVGIVVHSVVIGISLGASQSPDTIRPLVAALSFHQFFEGMGLGGCISQAEFKSLSVAIMGAFFSLTTPLGIGIGIGVSSFYKDKDRTGLIVEGVMNSASAGILIYMALVDLLAADFMNPRLQSNARLQLGVYVSLLLGTACMSVLATWA
ncbi:hypothetical protein GQ457_01G008130 [Hibiscus cannabinus]